MNFRRPAANTWDEFWMKASLRQPVGNVVAGESGKEGAQHAGWRTIATPTPASTTRGQSSAPAATAAASPP